MAFTSLSMLAFFTISGQFTGANCPNSISGGTRIDCFANSAASVNKTDNIPNNSAGPLQPSLTVQLTSTTSTNPSSVWLKIRYQPYCYADGMVMNLTTPNTVTARSSARATGTSYSASTMGEAPRWLNGTQQTSYSTGNRTGKTVTVIARYTLTNAWVPAGGVYQTSVTFGTGYVLTSESHATGPRLRKDESWSDASGRVGANLLQCSGTAIRPSTTGTLGGGVTRAVFVDVKDSMGALIDTYMVNLEETGLVTNLTLDQDDFLSQTVDAYYYCAGSLRKKVSVTGGTNSTFNFTPTLGDVNGDNTIDSTDTAILTTYQGKTAADDLGGYDFEMLDLDQSGTIDSADLTIASGNLGLSGDN